LVDYLYDSFISTVKNKKENDEKKSLWTKISFFI
jgi:hypothetical protein